MSLYRGVNFSGTVGYLFVHPLPDYAFIFYPNFFHVDYTALSGSNSKRASLSIVFSIFPKIIFQCPLFMFIFCTFKDFALVSAFHTSLMYSQSARNIFEANSLRCCNKFRLKIKPTKALLNTLSIQYKWPINRQQSQYNVPQTK